VGHLLSELPTALLRRRGALLPFAPVFFGMGIGGYFALSSEPLWWPWAILAGLCMLAAWRMGPGWGAVSIALGMALAGLAWASVRAQSVAAPVLEGRYYGPIEGRIVGIDRSASDAVRLTLDRVSLPRLPPQAQPARVRVSLYGEQGHFTPEPGARVALTGHLASPGGPVEPGGFDFQRHSWFLQLGGVGYTRSPVMLMQGAEGELWLYRLRVALSDGLRHRIPGETGAVAAAIVTGDRSAISQQVVDQLRATNLAHLLAISGLHMGLLTGFVFLVLRGGLALIAPLALRVPTKKIAAVGALVAGAFYLALAGGNVATERAFIQVAVMFLAVLLDRRAITLRSVAIAALIVLAHRPESLLGPGFQMSFAATTALVAVFNAVKNLGWLAAWPRWSRGVSGLVLSSAVAGLATAPFAAAHFNMWAVYGLAANLLTVPVMGSLVIPAAVVAGLLWPLGLDWIALTVMETGLNWILAVADRVARMEGAVQQVVAPPGAVLPLVALGALAVILWQGRGRWIGVVPVMMGVALWTAADRPAVLVSPSGGLVGVMGPEGRALSRPRGDGFVARIWLENDGDASGQAAAAGRSGWQEDGAGRGIVLAGMSLWHGTGRRGQADFARACGMYDWVITSEEPPEADGLSAPLADDILSGALLAPDDGRCRLIGPALLRQTGALALFPQRGGMRILTARAAQGQGPWVPDQ